MFPGITANTNLFPIHLFQCVLHQRQLSFTAHEDLPQFSLFDNAIVFPTKNIIICLPSLLWMDPWNIFQFLLYYKVNNSANILCLVSLFLLFVCLRQNLLCSLGWPRTYYENQADLRFTEMDGPASASAVQGLKTCTTMPSMNTHAHIYTCRLSISQQDNSKDDSACHTSLMTWIQSPRTMVQEENIGVP